MRTFTRLMTICLALTLLATAFIIPSSAKEGENMIKNGNFSRGMNTWNTWSSDPSAMSCTIDRTGGPDGSPCIKITNTKPVPSSLFFNADCKAGVSYILTCDMKYENVSSDNGAVGVCIGSSQYNAAGENVKESLSASSFGTSDWRTVTYIFKLDEDPARFAIGPRLWGSTGTLYVDNISLSAISDESAESGTYDLTLSDTANRHTVDALGCEWDPKILLSVNQKYGVTAEDLDVMKNYIQTLGLQAVRMMVTPDWFEKSNDNDDPYTADPTGFDFDNDEMRSLFAYLKVCEELGVRVTLTWWGAPADCWLACKNIQDWIGAPNDLDEAVENIAYLLGYIRNELGYNCIKELILQNEPSYSFRVDGGQVDFNYYVSFYQAMKKRLAADEMSDIVLVGADDSQHLGWYSQSVEGLQDICGKLNSHNYAWSYDTPYLDMLVQEFVEARTALAGDTPFYLGEFGDGSTVGAYVATSTETYGRGIYVASVVVNALKAGAAGASYWPLHDIYYYENTAGGDNGGLMSQGLIGFKKDGQWSFRPTYYAYGLLCNYIPYGSEVYDVSGDTDHYVDTVAIKTPEGRWSIVAVNRSDAAQTLRISASAIGTAMNTYTYAEGTLPTDQSMIAAGGRISPADGTYTVTLPATSMILLSNIHMTEAELESESKTETEAETETTGEETDESTSSTSSTATTGGVDEPSDTGCASVVSGAALTLSAAAAAVALRRRKE